LHPTRSSSNSFNVDDYEANADIDDFAQTWRSKRPENRSKTKKVLPYTVTKIKTLKN